MSFRTNLFVFSGLVLGLTACQAEKVEVKEQIRAIKSFTVSDSAGGSLRIYSGKLEAASSANLSFPIAGKIIKTNVQTGQSVAEGQVLAELDPVPFQLNISAARAELEKAKSTLLEKTDELDRNRKLFNKGWVSKAALQQAETAMKTSRSDVSFKQTKLNQVLNDFNDSKLKAPFDGVISSKKFEANEDANVGETVYSIDAVQALQVKINVPEQVVTQISIGMDAKATFSALDGQTLSGRVTEVDSAAGDGNIFGVKVTLLENSQDLRPGMSSEISLVTQKASEKNGYLIPLAAITVGDENATGYVFKYDAASSKLQKVPVVPETVRSNMIAVTGVQPGDVVASAGVSFLSDGLKVKLMR